MSSLEDIGFRMLSSRGDTTGAVVTTSAGEIWIGGALALGAMFGAVYAWPKPLRDLTTNYVWVELSAPVAERVLAGEVTDHEDLRWDTRNGPTPLSFWDDWSELEKLSRLREQGFDVASIEYPSGVFVRPGTTRLVVAPNQRCMEHEDCREHPELGRACMMAQWDEKWKEGAK